MNFSKKIKNRSKKLNFRISNFMIIFTNENGGTMNGELKQNLIQLGQETAFIFPYIN